MEYQNVIRDFAQRTRINLAHIEGSLSEGDEVYEVTQLVNSLLGLLVFPKERYYYSIPEIPLSTLDVLGWPNIKVVGDFQPAMNLREQVRYLRNAIAHFNIHFLTDIDNQISGVEVWNIRRGKMNWKAEIQLDELRIIVDKFIDLLLDEVKE